MTAIRYHISMPAPHTHLFHVTLAVDGPHPDALRVALPVWTPGSYMVREFARHVQQMRATTADGTALECRKIDKSCWEVLGADTGTVRISYQVYANDLTVRTSHLDGTHGYFNPASVCVYVPGREQEPCAVTVQVPQGWRITTGLPALGDDPTVRWDDVGREFLAAALGEASFLADSYDTLVDAPFECGTHRVLTFSVDGIPHEIAIWGHGNEDDARLIADTRTIVETEKAMFGGTLPYDRYVFIVHLADGRGGGLEHANSMTMLVDRFTFQPESAYERYLALTAHEFFHVWNVKRIRPDVLGPFDYQRENYTRQLWTMEGITSYYTDLLLLRAGLIDRARYLELLADKIVLLQSQPGRLVQSLHQSSFDAWIKLYRPDENSVNSSISYYLKGELVAMLLDVEIRRRSAGAHSLDDVMRFLYEHYPISGPGFAETDGFIAAVETVTGLHGQFDDFFARTLGSTEELPYDEVLAAAGLHLFWSHKRGGERPPLWLGVRTRTEHGKLLVAATLSGGPAERAGVYAGDELLALDGFRIGESTLNARLDERQAGDTVTISLFRRDVLLHMPLVLEHAPADRLALAEADDAPAGASALLTDWLGA